MLLSVSRDEKAFSKQSCEMKIRVKVGDWKGEVR